MSCRLCIAAALVTIMSAVGAADAATTNVKVVNGRNAPALVMDQTVVQPVHGNASVRLNAGEGSAFLELITPPAGKMVVIEYLSIHAFTREATANALLKLFGSLGEGAEIEHYLDAFPPPISIGVTSAFQQTLTQQVLLYSTGPVALNIQRGDKDALVGDFDVSFSGYLVKSPNGSKRP
jgi:hypothetical protein